MLTLRNLVKVSCVLFSVGAGASNMPLGTMLLPKVATFSNARYVVSDQGELKASFDGGIERIIPTGDYQARELLPIGERLWVTLAQTGNPDERLLFEITPVAEAHSLGRLARVKGVEVAVVLGATTVATFYHPVIGGALFAAVALQQGYQSAARRKAGTQPAPIEAFDAPETTDEDATLRVHEVLFGRSGEVDDVVVKNYAGRMYTLRSGLEVKDSCRNHIRARALR